MRLERWWFTAPLRLKAIFRRRQAELELDEELQFHLESKIEEGVAVGLSAEEARPGPCARWAAWTSGKRRSGTRAASTG